MQESYQNIARKFRPQTFDEVIGQDLVTRTLKNAVQSNRVSHAYLFCGSRGSGKTTLARILAKVLNCQNLNAAEPCNRCKSCTEITNGSSLDVIEIDGASNRGIDDMRHISETVSYTPSYGRYKIYIIDEVHMLTKEAFNALLKTLEEPPATVKFFFATTEPNKVLPTILSRCQRFDLNRISEKSIVHKLKMITASLEKEAEEEALKLLSRFADGSLRDAESHLDQVLCFTEGKLTKEIVATSLGMTTEEELTLLDQAIEKKDLTFAYSFTQKLYDQGKDLNYLLEEILLHFRNHLHHVLTGTKYTETTAFFSKEDLLFILDYLTEEKAKLSKAPLNKIGLEMIFLTLLRTKQRVSVESLISHLNHLESKAPASSAPSLEPEPKKVKAPSTSEIIQTAPAEPNSDKAPPKVEETKEPENLNHYTPAPSNKAKLDTLVRFAAEELEGRVKIGE